MVRNPLHLFTTLRDRRRYTRPETHRLVVNLVNDEDRLLREAYPGLAIPTVVIGNGVDIDRFRPPSDDERARARSALGLGPSDHCVLFIGNEFGRKGLPALIEAVTRLDEDVHLFVVGGTPDLVGAEAATAGALRLGARLHFAGAHPDPRPWLAAADVLASPSAYESYGLVVLEALACGVPVVATPTGCVPDVVVEGVNGAVVEGTASAVEDGLRRVLSIDHASASAAARASAMEHSWSAVADRYLAVLSRLADTPVRDAT
jgi:UDP-glucose:(heptosyl)LPS alpha-1,3-glucosyltransferase